MRSKPYFAKPAAALAVLLVAGVTYCAAYASFMKSTLALRLQESDGIDDDRTATPSRLSSAEQETLRRELAAEGLDTLVGDEQAKAVVEWLMNQVHTVGPAPKLLSPLQKLEAARAGTTGLLCGDMAVILHESLAVLGRSSRVVLLARSLLDNTDTHVVTEVLTDGKWNAFDPTFNVAFKSGANLVGIHEARHWAMAHKGPRVAPEFMGDVKYPARLDNYYLRYDFLLNYAMVETDTGIRAMGTLPIAAYFLRPKFMFEKDDVTYGTARSIQIYQMLFALMTLVAPILWLAAALTMLQWLRHEMNAARAT